MSMNKVTLLGRLSLDPELKEASSGSQTCQFSLATNESWTDKNGEKKDRVEYHRIVCWGSVATNCKQYLKKGDKALIEGSLHTRSWEDESGEKKFITEITANMVHFLSETSRSEIPAEPKREQAPVKKPYPSKTFSKPQSQYQNRQRA